MQRRSGNMLPPPADDYCNNSSASAGKLIVKNTSVRQDVINQHFSLLLFSLLLRSMLGRLFYTCESTAFSRMS
jgi:hypothetical protein